MDRQGIESLFNTCYNYIIYWEEEDMNKAVTVNGKECIKQYAYDFYGNKELVKKF